MQVRRDIACCGMREIQALGMHKNPTDAMKAFCKEVYGMGTPSPYPADRFRYVVFSEAVYQYDRPNPHNQYGRNFADFIKKNKLGSVAGTTWNTNPNSGNRLKAWLWTVNHDAIKAWAKKLKVDKVVKTPRKGKSKPMPIPGPPPGAVPAAQVVING